MQAIVRRNDLPGFALRLEFGSGEPFLRMTRRSEAEVCRADPPQQRTATPAQPARSLAENLIERIRHDFPGWDIYALQAEFDAWIAAEPKRAPNDYSKAF